LSFNAAICTLLLDLVLQLWISMQSVIKIHLFFCKLVVLSVCNSHMMTILVSQIFIVLLEFIISYNINVSAVVQFAL